MPVVIFKGRSIHYQLKRNARAKRLTLSIQNNGDLLVVVPVNFKRLRIVEKFIQEKSNWILDKKKIISQYRQGQIKFDRHDYLANKEQALNLVKEKIAIFNQIYNFKINRISIRNQKSRWGSCSAKGNLNFNYRLIFLPGYIVDYIVVHELAHLKELNHSPNFWKLISQIIPNYSSIRKELRVYSRKLL